MLPHIFCHHVRKSEDHHLRSPDSVITSVHTAPHLTPPVQASFVYENAVYENSSSVVGFPEPSAPEMPALSPHIPFVHQSTKVHFPFEKQVFAAGQPIDPAVFEAENVAYRKMFQSMNLPNQVRTKAHSQPVPHANMSGPCVHQHHKHVHT